MTSSIRILLACNHPPHQRRIIAASGGEMVVAADRAAFDEQLHSGQFQLVLLDAAFPQPDLQAVVSHHLPVIVVSEEATTAAAVRAMKNGASDYLIFDNDFETRLNAAVEDCLTPALPDHLSPQLFRSVYDDAPIMMFIFDVDGIVLDMNQCCLNELGYTREAILGQPVSKMLTPESVQLAIKVCLPQLWRDGSVVDASHQMVTQGGDVLDVLINSKVVRTTNGAPVALSIARNVTDHRRIAAAEREQRALTEALRDTTVALTSTLNFDEVLDRILANVARVVPYDSSNIMLVQGSLARMVRNQRSGSLGREIDVPTVDFIIPHTPTLRIMAETGNALVIACTENDPNWVDLPQSAWIKSFVGAPIRERDQVIGFLTLNCGTPGAFNERHAERLQAFANQAAIAIRNARLYDAAQRHADELEQRVNKRTAQLNIERNQLYAILQSTGEGIFYAEDDLIRYINPALTSLTGYSAEDLIGRPVTVLYGEDKWQSMVEAVEKGDIWRGELSIRCKDGSELDAGLTVGRGSQPQDSPLRTVVMVRDIRREKALQNQKSRFIANASHELRTPIQNIITRLYLIKKQPARINDHIDVIEDVTRRMRNLVEDLLDLTRFERGHIPLEQRPVNLGTLIASMVDVQQADAHLKNISLTTVIPESSLYVLGDPERLGQVLTNLVVNALNYTPAGGRVTVKLQQRQNTAIIRVEDTGIGIEAAHLEQIFEPFVRVNEDRQGSGLGLSIAREIIEMHNGMIDVNSKPGQGSCFTIALQLAPVAVGHINS